MLNNRDILPILIKAVAEAKQEVTLAHLEFLTGNGPNQVAAQLAAAAARGVNVRVILDQDVDENPAAVATFNAQGIRARLGGSERTLHVKLVVVDRTMVLVGSTNFSTSSLLYNNETNWYFNDPALGDAFADYAEGLFAGDTGLRTMVAGPFANVTPIGDGQYEQRVLPVIAAAEDRLLLVMYDLDYDTSSGSDAGNLARAVIKAHQRGVDVRVILEMSGWDDTLNAHNQAARTLFASAGVPVRRDSANVTTHAKLLVADDTVVIYSGNWVYTGMQRNHEAGAMHSNKVIADSAEAYFNTIWAASN